MLVDRVQLGPPDREEVEENPHHQPDIVAPESDPPGLLVELGTRARAVTQAEVDEAKRQEPERAKQRGVRVVERQEGAVLVVIDERGIERAAAEDSGADEVPEGRAEDVEIGEAVIECRGALDQPVLRDRLEDQEDQRKHLDEGEHRAERHPHARPAAPIKVVPGPQHAAEEDEDELEVDRALGELAGNQAEGHQQIGAHRDREEFERLFDPQVDDPPAPEVGDRERFLDPRERDHAEDVEHGDVDGRGPDQMLEADLPAPELLRRFDDRVAARPQRPEHEAAPAQQRHEEQDLPEAPELDVGQALVSEPEPAFVDQPLDAEVIAEQRGTDHEQRDPEQEIDEESLPLRLAPSGDRRRDEQPARDPAEPDPDDRRLEVEASQEVEREDVVELDPVEVFPLVIGVRHDRARALRGEEHQCDHEEIFAGLDLAWSQRSIGREPALHRLVVGMVEIGPVEPQHEPHRKEGEAEADPGPLEGVGRRRVPDGRLIGPVLGPRGLRVIGTPCNRGDRRVNDEIGRLPAQHGIEALRGHPAGRQVHCVELGCELSLQLAHRLSHGVGQDDRGLCKIDPLELFLHRRRRARIGERFGGRSRSRCRRLGRRARGPGGRE